MLRPVSIVVVGVRARQSSGQSGMMTSVTPGSSFLCAVRCPHARGRRHTQGRHTTGASSWSRLQGGGVGFWI
ncbi:hypothetical protein CGRA01v4_07459 [Colletotrichum graminicola]|nr:hypothetical protein CGRA01v4_07459 [Colletotrichum graminicola]